MPAFSKFDLPALAKAKTARKSLTLRPINPTLALERELAAVYLRVVRAWRQVIAETVLPAYHVMHERITMDDVTGTTAAAIDRAKLEALRVVTEARNAAAAWTVRVEKWHTGTWAKIVEAGTGVKIAGVLLNEDAADQIGIALERNAALIRGLSDDLAKRVEHAIWQGLANQTSRRKVAKELQEALNISRDRALRISVDQSNKLSGELDKLRQQQAGITTYEWRHSGKLHFRPEHKARNGKSFKWSAPPSDGHPKSLPFCGCSALPELNF